MNKLFEEDIIRGLSATPKQLPFKYVYDNEGSRLFQAIMGLSDYYLTDSEFEIFYANKSKILKHLGKDVKTFNLIEFAAGNALKTKVLIEHFLNENRKFSYIPVDISESSLKMLTKELTYTFPKLNVNAISGDYLQVLNKIAYKDNCRNVVFFLGAGIGNFSPDEALCFLSNLSQKLNKGDIVVIGFDLMKDPGKIIRTYSDKFGIINEFYLNILNRINEEFDADFNLNSFYHYPNYDPISGEAKNYLISRLTQTVVINKLACRVDFEYSEPIFIELAKKYTLEEIESLSKECGYEIIEHFIDGQHYFLDAFWQVK